MPAFSDKIEIETEAQSTEAAEAHEQLSDIVPDVARILVLFDGDEDRDLDPMLADISNALVEAGHVVGNIFAGAASEYPNPVLLRSNPILELEKRRVISLSMAISALVREHQPNVLIAASKLTRAAISLIKIWGNKRPYVVFYENGTATAKRSWLFRRNNDYGAADRVITTSHAAKANIDTVLPDLADKTVALLPPLISPAMEYRRRVPSQHPWLETESCPVLISCDPLTGSKHQLALIDAIAHFNKTTDLRLILLGTGTNRKAVESRIDNLGIRPKIDIIPDITDPLPFIARASAMINTEPTIGIPRTLVEALSLSCPVIAVNHADAVSEIIMTRFCAKHVSPHDPNAIPNAIVGILSRPGAAVNGLVGRFRNSRVLSGHVDACLGKPMIQNKYLQR